MIDELKDALAFRQRKKEELYLSYLILLKAIMTINPHIKTIDFNLLLTEASNLCSLYPYDFKIIGFNSIAFESTINTPEQYNSFLLNVNLKQPEYLQLRQKMAVDNQTIQFIYALSGRGIGLKNVPRQMFNVTLELIEELLDNYNKVKNANQ